MQNKDEERKARYHELLETLTRTAARVEFLQECLESGMSKRQASRELVKVEPLLSHGSAETIVYMNFSGKYRTSKLGIKRVAAPKTARIAAPSSVEDDEGLL